MSSRVIPSSPELSKLADRQLRNWEMARQQRSRDSERSTSETVDFICLSRQVGAGGSKVAKLLGERLGWPVFDREVRQR